jgi:hypothetical protein
MTLASERPDLSTTIGVIVDLFFDITHRGVEI